jgi:hypothetical protein
MKCAIYSHASGEEAIPPEIIGEVKSAVSATAVRIESGASPKIREGLLAQLKMFGWSGEVPVAIASDMTITSMKKKTGLCLQTGNAARIHSDLIKLQTMFFDGAIDSAVIMLPSKPAAMALGSNIAQDARLTRELRIFRKVYSVPTVIFALE